MASGVMSATCVYACACCRRERSPNIFRHNSIRTRPVGRPSRVLNAQTDILAGSCRPSKGKLTIWALLLQRPLMNWNRFRWTICGGAAAAG